MLRPPVDPVDRRYRVPGRVRAEIERLRSELLTRTAHEPLALETLLRDPAPSPPPHALLGVAALAGGDGDPLELLDRARLALAPGGRLLLLEPYRRTRWIGRLADLTAPGLRRITRLRLDLPVADLVRRAGFVIASVERVSMPTLIAPLRSFCLIVAEVSAAASAPAATTDGVDGAGSAS